MAETNVNFNALREALRAAVRRQKDNLARLERALGALDEIATLADEVSDYLPQEVDRPPRRAFVVAQRAVHSFTDYRKRYTVKKWRTGVGGLIVYTCDCPRFKYTRGDMWEGSRAYCKHIIESMGSVMGWNRP